MYQKFHKGLAHQLPRAAVWGTHVDEAVEWEQDRHLADAQGLVHDALAPETRETLVPNR